MEFFEEKESNRLHWLTEWAVDCAVMVALACYLVFCFGSRIEMNGSSMKPVLESGDVVLMKSDLMDVYRAIKLSKETIRNIKQNLFWAFFYNSLGIPVAAGVLYLLGGPLLSPMIGGFAMSLSSVCVVGNALRLRNLKL